ncbi:glutamic acid-rich protein-like [Bombyx mandarina]|uniref:Glutamic acid-rich protein-like n=1 Tax=Bombyx mandarina TaxID=7092 RepID=A0A6J2JZC1_BOMMA|nr:glutamic acid-rich protein-like [Bombyx mandarina]XP_028035297.1 glutamic acid-rich protein-like [Bombyx mandarina]
MPIGNVSKETAPRRDSFRPPWVKEKDTESPPAWTQRKLKPVDSFGKTATAESTDAAPITKPLKPVLKKQVTIREKSENGSSETVEEKLVKPSTAKQADRANNPTDEKSRFTKPALKTIDKSIKSEDKVTNDKIPEKSTLKSVRTIDDKAKEKSVTIVDRKPDRNGTDKANNSVNDKITNDKGSTLNNNTKTINKVGAPEKSISKTVAPKSSQTSEKPAPKSTTEKNSKSPAVDKPVTKSSEKLTSKTTAPEKPAPKETSQKTAAPEKTEEVSKMATKPPLEKTPSKVLRKPPLQKQPSKDEIQVKKWRDPLLERVKENIDKTLNNEVPKGHTLTKNESLRSLLKPTPPPMPPPLPPKMPPPPEFKKAPVDPAKLKRLEQLRSRPRRRPDWSDMMKEVEEGRKLRHVECNDRSNPIITRSTIVKNKGQFIFESEKPNTHNELLKEINKGIKLKKVKTNDRSKPNLEGLRKFRRQMTIEEQVQKSMSQANLAASPSGVLVPEGAAPQEEEEIDEMDDIDKVRDDLQSTKQLLAMELRTKEAQEREIKRLQTRIQNLEAEVARERAIIKQEQQKTVISVTDAYDERLVKNLKEEVEKAKESADNLEKKYLEAAEERDTAITEAEELKRRNAELEKKLEQAMAGIMPTGVGSRRSSHAIKQLSVTKDDSFEEESESEPEEEESEEKKQKRLEKEVKNMKNKIKHLKEKQDHMKKERMGFKMALKNQQAALKEEKRKYKELKREVDKMAAMMKEVGSDEEEEEEEEEESEEEKKTESEEEESETETEQDTESETESESEPEDAPLPNKKDNLTKRMKRHETRVHALKKGNALLMANVDRLKDDVLKQREESVSLQKELDSLIDDLE